MPQSGDSLADALTPEAYGAAWRHCCRLCASREDAEDLLQDSLAHALSRWGQLRDPAALTAWLLRIVRTRWLAARRRGKLPLAPEAEPLARLEAADPRAEATLEALGRLPREQRELLVLFYVEGLSLAECGAALGLSATVVRHRLHRARGVLRRRLGLADDGAGRTAEEKIR